MCSKRMVYRPTPYLSQSRLIILSPCSLSMKTLALLTAAPSINCILTSISPNIKERLILHVRVKVRRSNLAVHATTSQRFKVNVTGPNQISMQLQHQRDIDIVYHSLEYELLLWWAEFVSFSGNRNLKKSNFACRETDFFLNIRFRLEF